MRKRTNSSGEPANGGTTDAPVTSNDAPGSTDGTVNDPEIIAGFDAFDPGSIGNAGADTGTGTGGPTPIKRRGRKPGTRNAPKAVQENIAGGVEKVLLSMHAIMAAFTGIEHLALDPTEAKTLSDGIMEVQRHYPIAIDPKTMAWVNLAVIAGSIYIPRVIVIRNESKARGPARVQSIRPEPLTSKPNGAPAPPIQPITNPSQLYMGMDGAGLGD